MGFAAEADPEESYDIKDSLNRAGLFDVEPPRLGTKAYDRLIAAAEAYMNEVRRIEFARPESPIVFIFENSAAKKAGRRFK